MRPSEPGPGRPSGPGPWRPANPGPGRPSGPAPARPSGPCPARPFKRGGPPGPPSPLGPRRPIPAPGGRPLPFGPGRSAPSAGGCSKSIDAAAAAARTSPSISSSIGVMTVSTRRRIVAATCSYASGDCRSATKCRCNSGRKMPSHITSRSGPKMPGGPSGGRAAGGGPEGTEPSGGPLRGCATAIVPPTMVASAPAIRTRLAHISRLQPH